MLGACIDKTLPNFAGLGVDDNVAGFDYGTAVGSVDTATAHDARRNRDHLRPRRGASEVRGRIIVIVDAYDSSDRSKVAPFPRKHDEVIDRIAGVMPGLPIP